MHKNTLISLHAQRPQFKQVMYILYCYSSDLSVDSGCANLTCLLDAQSPSCTLGHLLFHDFHYNSATPLYHSLPSGMVTWQVQFLYMLLSRQSLFLRISLTGITCPVFSACVIDDFCCLFWGSFRLTSKGYLSSLVICMYALSCAGSIQCTTQYNFCISDSVFFKVCHTVTQIVLIFAAHNQLLREIDG